MKNSLGDVHNHLMARLEALGDEGLTGEALDCEIARAKAACAVSRAITDNARVMLDGYRAEIEATGSQAGRPPRFLADGRDR